jgi:hypothetical protein
VILASYQENLLAPGGEACSSCWELASDSSVNFTNISTVVYKYAFITHLNKVSRCIITIFKQHSVLLPLQFYCHLTHYHNTQQKTVLKNSNKLNITWYRKELKTTIQRNDFWLNLSRNYQYQIQFKQVQGQSERGRWRDIQCPLTILSIRITTKHLPEILEDHNNTSSVLNRWTVYDTLLSSVFPIVHQMDQQVKGQHLSGPLE